MTAGTRVASRWRVPRTHGLVSGGLLLLLGFWGGAAPFIGPYLNFGFTPDAPWTLTWGRLWLAIVPAAVTVVAAAALVFSSSRVTGVWMSCLAVLAGAWFVVGGAVSRLWTGGTSQAGSPTGDVVSQVTQQVGLFLGLGVMIVFLGAIALTRFALPRFKPAVETETEPYPETYLVEGVDEEDQGDILPWR